MAVALFLNSLQRHACIFSACGGASGLGGSRKKVQLCKIRERKMDTESEERTSRSANIYTGTSNSQHVRGGFGGVYVSLHEPSSHNASGLYTAFQVKLF